LANVHIEISEETAEHRSDAAHVSSPKYPKSVTAGAAKTANRFVTSASEFFVGGPWNANGFSLMFE